MPAAFFSYSWSISCERQSTYRVRGSMRIVTTIYYAEATDSNQGARDNGQLEVNVLEETERQWLSIYEGMYRVEPIDGDR
jgi:hypothetical protein